MSQSIDNAAMVLCRMWVEATRGHPLYDAAPWEQLSNREKEEYRRMVWGILHALFNDMNNVSVNPKEDIVFEQDTAIMLYTAMATPKNSWLGIVNQEGRTVAEALVTALDGALRIVRE